MCVCVCYVYVYLKATPLPPAPLSLVLGIPEAWRLCGLLWVFEAVLGFITCFQRNPLEASGSCSEPSWRPLRNLSEVFYGSLWVLDGLGAVLELSCGCLGLLRLYWRSLGAFWRGPGALWVASCWPLGRLLGLLGASGDPLEASW